MKAKSAGYVCREEKGAKTDKEEVVGEEGAEMAG